MIGKLGQILFLMIALSAILRLCGAGEDGYTPPKRVEQKTECERFAERVVRRSGGSEHSLIEACEKEEERRLWETDYEEALRKLNEENR